MLVAKSIYFIYIQILQKPNESCWITDVEENVFSLVSCCLVGHHPVSYFLFDDVVKVHPIPFYSPRQFLLTRYILCDSVRFIVGTRTVVSANNLIEKYQEQTHPNPSTWVTVELRLRVVWNMKRNVKPERISRTASLNASIQRIKCSRWIHALFIRQLE